MIIHMLEALGKEIIRILEVVGHMAILTGQTVYHLFQGRKRYGNTIQQMAHLGIGTLPIVLLTMLFTGMVMTMQTAHEFLKYGAGSTVGGVIALAMGRELGPVLTGVVAAGRVGAAIAAEIGSMKVTEQIDALRVMATNPVAYLVVPRVIACVFMIPLLVVFADAIGTLGGFFVATQYFAISFYTFTSSITSFADINDVTGGLIKAAVFGFIIAIIGCYKGLNASEGAEGVGRATTGSVVTSIVLIFVTNYFLSLILF
jgi:phospholipid/cholesterol/gamma-HCH transport system permease protein